MKIEQIAWQLIYRIQKRPVLRFQSSVGSTANRSLGPFLHEKTSWLGGHSFTFLNLHHDFQREMIWDEAGHGKLWTYKLNYFEFLHQEGITKNEGLNFMHDFVGKSRELQTGIEPYPISLRGINWIKFLIHHSIQDNRIDESLFAQYVLLGKRLEFHLLGNHLLENAFSLLFAGIYFEEQRFLEPAVRLLERELTEQILDDGAHFELSPMYHCILLQRILDCINLLQHNEHSLAETERLLREKASVMIGWLKAIQFSNGDLPMVNDAVHGEYPDPDKLIAYSASLGIHVQSVVLSTSGYRFLRSGPFESLADVGPIGPSYIPGHAHADSLQTLLYVDGKPILVDPAVSTYQKNKLRDEERGTWTHNTITVNKSNSSDVWGGFRVGKRASTTILKDEANRLMATHDGYNHFGTEHQREWVLDVNNLIIKDSLCSKTGVKHIASFHLHPGVRITKRADLSFQIDNIVMNFSDVTRIEVENYSYNSGFNLHQTAKVIRVQFDSELTTIIQTVN